MTLRIGCLVMPWISRYRACAAEGLEWESTTTTPIVGQNHRSVGIHLVPRCSNSSVHAVRHLLEFEEVFVSGLGVSREHAAGIDVLERLDGRRRDANVR